MSSDATPIKEKKISKALSATCTLKLEKVLGRVFRCIHSYRAPDVVRIIGWTKSGKSLHAERVPLIIHQVDRSKGYVDGGSCEIDEKWLLEHKAAKKPVFTKPFTGETFRIPKDYLEYLQNDEMQVSDEPKKHLYFSQDGHEAYWAIDEHDSPSVSWCDY